MIYFEVWVSKFHFCSDIDRRSRVVVKGGFQGLIQGQGGGGGGGVDWF